MSISETGGQPTAPPACEVRPHGLMSAAWADPREDYGWARGLEFDRMPCGQQVSASAQPCPPLAEQLHKAATRGYDTVTQDAFTLYAGWECSAVEAADGDRPWAMADALYEQGWRHALERAFWTGEDQDGNQLPTSLAGGDGSNVEDLTPAAGALSIVEAVAAIESWMADNSTCVPTIHANVGVGPYMSAKALLRHGDDGVLRMYSGTRVALGGGYLATGPGGVEPDPDVAWIFATGPVRVTWGPTFHTPGRGDLAGAVARSSNDVTVYTEQTFSIGLGCGIAAVQVALSGV